MPQADEDLASSQSRRSRDRQRQRDSFDSTNGGFYERLGRENDAAGLSSRDVLKNGDSRYRDKDRNDGYERTSAKSNIGRAASETRAYLTSTTTNKRSSTLTGQNENDSSNLLATDPDQYFKEITGAVDMGYIDGDLIGKISPEEYNQRYEKMADRFYDNYNKKIGLNHAGKMFAPALTKAATKSVGGPLGGIIGTAVGYASSNAGDIVEQTQNLGLDEIDRSIYDDVARRARKAIDDDKSFRKYIGKGFSAVGEYGSTVAALIAPQIAPVAAGVGGVFSIAGDGIQHRAGKQAIAKAFGGGVLEKYKQELESIRQNRKEEKLRRLEEGQTRRYGILNNMTNRLQQQPSTVTNKRPSELPDLGHLWSNIKFQ